MSRCAILCRHHFAVLVCLLVYCSLFHFLPLISFYMLTAWGRQKATVAGPWTEPSRHEWQQRWHWLNQTHYMESDQKGGAGVEAGCKKACRVSTMRGQLKPFKWCFLFEICPWLHRRKPAAWFPLFGNHTIKIHLSLHCLGSIASTQPHVALCGGNCINPRTFSLVRDNESNLNLNDNFKPMLTLSFLARYIDN